MIRITRENGIVYVGFDTDIINQAGEKTTIWFTLNTGDVTHAELMTRYLRENFNNMIFDMRKAEFFSGWKHAVAKKHGKSYFGWFRRTFDKFCSHD